MLLCCYNEDMGIEVNKELLSWKKMEFFVRLLVVEVSLIGIAGGQGKN